MAFELKEGQFYLFKNVAKEGKVLHENAPQYKGVGLVDGKEKDCALWYNKEKGYFFVTVKKKWEPKEKKQQVDEEQENLPF